MERGAESRVAQFQNGNVGAAHPGVFFPMSVQTSTSATAPAFKNKRKEWNGAEKKSTVRLNNFENCTKG